MPTFVGKDRYEFLNLLGTMSTRKMGYWMAIALLVGATSCVSKKKYLEAENGRLDALQREATLRSQLVDCRDEGDLLSGQVAQLKRDTANMRRDIRSYQEMLSTDNQSVAGDDRRAERKGSTDSGERQRCLDGLQ